MVSDENQTKQEMSGQTEKQELEKKEKKAEKEEEKEGLEENGNGAVQNEQNKEQQNSEQRQEKLVGEELQSASGSSKASDSQEEYAKKVAEVDKLLGEGKKLSLAESYEEAASKYGNAAQIATEFFGQFSHECFQPALNYAKMLIEVARFESAEQPISEQKLGLNETKEEDKVDDSEAVDAEEEEEGKDEEEEEAADDTVDDIQTAWEWLEIAKKICEKQEKSFFWQECLSDVLMSQGECMTVDDEFGQAIEAFESALRVRQEIFAPNDRRIAEVLFLLGLTYGNLDEFIVSSEYFERAKGVLESTTEAREKELVEEEAKENNDKETIEKLKTEIVELKKLIVSITDHKNDAQESAESRVRQKEAISNIIAESIVGGGEQKDLSIQQNNGKVTDVTELLKRKLPQKRAATDDGGDDNEKQEPSARRANLDPS